MMSSSTVSLEEKLQALGFTDEKIDELYQIHLEKEKQKEEERKNQTIIKFIGWEDYWITC